MRQRQSNAAMDPRTIPTEQLFEQTENPTQPGLYVLELDNPGSDLHDHARRWYANHQAVHPVEVGGLVGTERLLYVGAASNLQSRLEDHVQADARKSTWLAVYPPVELVQASELGTTSQAFGTETQKAYELADRTPGTTVVVCDGELVG